VPEFKGSWFEVARGLALRRTVALPRPKPVNGAFRAGARFAGLAVRVRALHLSPRGAAREDHRQIVMALTGSSPEKTIVRLRYPT
jgi:hypothetical protein